jgi:hypothetical protein
MLLGSADALDSVVCAFAAVAVSTRTAPIPKSPRVATDGWWLCTPT